MKKNISVFVSVLLLAVLCIVPTAAATLTSVETQFTYSTSNPAWLKDLVINENMTDTQGVITPSALIAKPDYPYSKTPEGFRTEVNYYCRLYALDEGSQKAAYLFVLQYINQFATEATRNVSDEFIMEYLQQAGITYPEGGLGDYENLIFARSLYTLMTSGAVAVNITPGATVQGALIQYMTKIFNIDAATLGKWSSTSVDTLDAYVLVACKIALNTNGYTVDRNTDAKEVYRLTAIMMIRQLGISVNEETATFDEIKIKYLAALLGQQYDISLDPDDLQTALDRNEVPFYILQVMGRSANVTIRSSMSYSDAFTAVAENTDYFLLEKGEFYADIYKYEVYLNYKRSRIWVCPTAYRTSTATETIMIRIGSDATAGGAYFEYQLDPALSSQNIEITVTYQSAAQTVSKTYTVTVYQGSSEAPDSSDNLFTGNGNSLIGIASGNIVNTLANSFYSVSAALPSRVTGIMSLMVPDLNQQENSSAASSQSGTSSGTDYLSQLMGTSSGITGNSTGLAAGNLSSGYDASAQTGNPTNAQSSLSVGDSGMQLQGEPMHISQAGDPPSGYEYKTDSQGYITGLLSVQRHNGAENIEKNDISFSSIRNKLLLILIPLSLACIALIVVTVMKKREKGQKTRPVDQ